MTSYSRLAVVAAAALLFSGPATAAEKRYGLTSFEAIEVGADVVLLDNMAPDDLRRAVELVGGRMVTEASGRITPETAAAIAESGVDLISVGWLTHSARVLDIGLDHA